MTENNVFCQTLNNEIGDVDIYSDVMDKRFAHEKVEETLLRFRTFEYTPLGYCRKSKFRHANGVVFFVVDRENTKRWAFIPASVFRGWLIQCGIDWVEHPSCRGFLNRHKRFVYNTAKAQGATDEQLSLITDEFIKESLRNGKTPREIVSEIL